MVFKDGIVPKEEWSRRLPSEERRKAGPYVIMECLQEIPCDPCVKACRFGAVSMERITDLPEVLADRCTGCGVCVGACPGQACFVIDESRSEENFLLTLPYEMLPAPEAGGEAELLNRSGEPVGTGRILRAKETDHTWVVTVEVPKQYLYDVRNIRPGQPGERTE